MIGIFVAGKHTQHDPLRVCADAYSGVTTGRGHLTVKRNPVWADFQQVLAEREIGAAIAAENNDTNLS